MNSTSISIASNISAFSVADTMLIKESYQDVPTKAGGKDGSMRIYVIEPNVPEFPEAKFPGVVVFSEVSLRSLSDSKRSCCSFNSIIQNPKNSGG